MLRMVGRTVIGVKRGAAEISSTVTVLFGLPSARPPSTPTPEKSRASTAADGGGMSGRMTVGGDSVWNPCATSTSTGGGASSIGGGGGGGGGGGASSGMSNTVNASRISSAASPTLIVAQKRPPISATWNSRESRPASAPDLPSRGGLLATRVENIGGSAGGRFTRGELVVSFPAT